MTKQELIDAISSAAGLGTYVVGSGSTEPSAFYVDLAGALGYSDLASMPKPQIAEGIVTRAGLEWDAACDSRNSTSGGGSTVTVEGLSRLRSATYKFFEDRLHLAGDIHVNIRPKAGALRIFRNLTFKAWYALGEFIDNSITSALLNVDELTSSSLGGYSLNVEIEFDSRTNALVVRDNAAGIPFSEIERALRTSEPPPDTGVGLGLHGVGMKAAAFWWGERLTVESFPIGRAQGWRASIDLDDLDEDADGTVDIEPINSDGRHGTVITIDRLWNGVPRGRTSGSIKGFLPSIYRSFLSERFVIDDGRHAIHRQSNLNLHLRYNGEELTYEPPALLVEPFWPDKDGPRRGSPPIEWFQEYEIKLASGRVISGWVGILERMSRDLAGFALQYRGKSIAGIAANFDEDAASISPERGAYKPRRIFGQQGLYLDQSFVGEFDLSDFGKSITTDSVSWTSEEEDEFVAALYEEMKRPEMNFIAQANNFRRRKKSEVARQRDRSALELEVNTLVDAINQAEVGHSEPPQELAKPSLDESDLVVAESISRAISDPEGHIHLLIIDLVDNQVSPLFHLAESGPNSENHMTVNVGHASIDDLAPVEGQVLEMLLRIAIVVATVEIFAPGTPVDRTRFRRKMNEVFDARARLTTLREREL